MITALAVPVIGMQGWIGFSLSSGRVNLHLLWLHFRLRLSTASYSSGKADKLRLLTVAYLACGILLWSRYWQRVRSWDHCQWNIVGLKNREYVVFDITLRYKQRKFKEYYIEEVHDKTTSMELRNIYAQLNNKRNLFCTVKARLVQNKKIE